MRTDDGEWTDSPAPYQLGRRMLRQAVGRWWWAPLAAGVTWFLVAWVVLRADVTSLATVGALVGVALLLAAINEAGLAVLAVGGWRVAHYLAGAVCVLGAAWAFVRPIDTFFALASVLGLILLLQGALYVVRGIALRDLSPYWSLELLNGVLLTLLGLWVSISDRVFGLAGRTAFILLWVGFMALFRGVSDMVLAFSMLRFAKAGGQPGVGPAVGPSPRPEAPSRSRG